MQRLATRAIWRAADEIGLGLSAVVLVSETGSTNSLALDYLKQGWPDGVCVLAVHQTRGRGRRGRTWFSGAGSGLCLSVGLQPSREELRQSSPTLAAALAVVRSLEELAPELPKVQLRWPNDLVFQGRKLCGVLAELQTPAHTGPQLVVGVGLNLAPLPEDVPEDVRQRATSVQELLGRPIDPNLFVARMIFNLALCRARPLETLAEARRRSETLGRRVRVRTPAGLIVGQAIDLGGLGSLIIETSEGRRALHAGELIEPLAHEVADEA